MKILIIILTLFSGVPLFAQQGNEFKNLKFDKVVMYDFEPIDKGGSIVEANGLLTNTIKKQVQLDNLIVNKLNSKLGNKKSFGGAAAACFEPHLGFVYYLNNKIVGHITICLECNRLVSSIPIKVQKATKVGKGKDAYFLQNNGMSKPFRIFLNDLLKQNNFSDQEEFLK